MNRLAAFALMAVFVVVCLLSGDDEPHVAR
jgi:hypothetical protein